MHKYSEDGGIIRVEASGFFSDEEMRTHFEDFSRILYRRRNAGMRVAVLVDMRAAPPQSPGTSKIISYTTRRIYSDPSDLVAIVASSTLLRLQLERVHSHPGFGVFLTIPDAERFLTGATAVAA